METKNKESNFYKILGRFFTDKSFIDESVKWKRKIKKYVDKKWKKKYEGKIVKYDLSELERATTFFEGCKIFTKEERHHYKEDVYCPVLGDYLYTNDNECDSMLILKIKNGAKEIELTGQSMWDVKKEVFKNLMYQGSLMKYLNKKGILSKFSKDYFSSFFERTLVINDKEYKSCAEELEITLPTNLDEKKPEVALAEAVRFPEDRFWQPYSIIIKLKESFKNDFDNKIESFVFVNILSELLKEHSNLYAFIKQREGRFDNGIYFGHKNVKFHKDADEIIDFIKKFQGKEKFMNNKIKELKEMSYNNLEIFLKEHPLPVRNKESLSLLD